MSEVGRGDIYVGDTNVLLDLMSAGVLRRLFELPARVWTVDLVLEEVVRAPQRAELDALAASGLLSVRRLSGEEVAEAAAFYQTFRGNVSFTDAAVVMVAARMGGVVLTGDRQMRRQAEERGVAARGTLFVLDEMVRLGVLDGPGARSALAAFMAANARLPHGECERRMEEWGRV